MDPKIRLLFSCTGIGIMNRGFEAFFREAFDGLRSSESAEICLLTGRGKTVELDGHRERPAWVLPRIGGLPKVIGRLTGRNAYTVEQWSSFPSVVLEIRRFRPHLVFTSDANLMFLLRRFRGHIGVPFRVLYSNGGPCHPPFDRHDFVHQVAPFYLDEALATGEHESKHLFVPYGIHIPSTTSMQAEERRSLRRQLGLPLDRPVILSVGWIASQHKRMDYVIDEVAALPEPRPFLQLLGAMDEGSAAIISQGVERLGRDNFSAASVPPEAVADFYRAADIFVLGSLAEGFGRVYLEALSHGLPTIGHRHPVIEYVLGGAGVVGDLSTPGGLTTILVEELQRLTFATPMDADVRRESVRSRFSWEILRPAYAEMFRHAAVAPMPWVTG